MTDVSRPSPSNFGKAMDALDDVRHNVRICGRELGDCRPQDALQRIQAMRALLDEAEHYIRLGEP